MERDRRLTGYLRGQSDKPIAPKGFELNNPWKVRVFSEIWHELGRHTDTKFRSRSALSEQES